MEVLKVLGFKTTNNFTIYDVFNYFSHETLLFSVDLLNNQSIQNMLDGTNNVIDNNENDIINNSKDLLVMIDKMKSLGYKIMLEIIKETGFIYFSYTKICLSIICIVRKYFKIKPIWNES